LFIFRATGNINIATESAIKPRAKTRTLTLDRSIAAGEESNGHRDCVNAMVIYKDMLISGSSDTTIKVWSTDTWECLDTLVDHEDKIYSMCICADKLISCSGDGIINVWQYNCTTGDSSDVGWELLHTLDSEDDSRIETVTDCEGRIASGSENGNIILWNTKSWTRDLTIRHYALDANGHFSD
jgi:WD40 repeat protein